MAARASDSFDQLTDALKVAVAALREAEVPFALGGSFAAWARGGPPPQTDLDLMVKPVDADRALDTLAAAGMRTEHPPEEWLYKAWHGAVLIDVIFRPSGLEITDEVLARTDQISVLAVATPVMALEDVLLTKLKAMNEHSLDYCSLLGIARAVREQIDWRSLAQRADDSPYAAAFFTLVSELGVAPRELVRPRPVSPAAGQPPGRVRVVGE
jgi:hypothetical protein